MSKQRALPSCALWWCGPRAVEASDLGCGPRSSRGNHTRLQSQPLQNEQLTSQQLPQQPPLRRQQQRQQQHLGHKPEGHVALRVSLQRKLQSCQVRRRLQNLRHLRRKSPLHPRSSPPVQGPRCRVAWLWHLPQRMARARAHSQHPQVQGPPRMMRMARARSHSQQSQVQGPPVMALVQM